MKLLFSLSFYLVSLASAFDVPSGSYHLGQIDDVAKVAAKDQQPVAFVITTKKMAAT